MGWSDQNIIASVIVVEGPGDGLFIYNGTGELGNPPILAAVAPGVTEDPFGNPVKAVMNIGDFSAGHVGWDDNGNTYVSDPNGKTRIVMTGGAGGVWPGAPDPAVIFYNSSGAVTLVVDPQAGGIFQYEDLGSASQGTLIGAQSFKAGGTTDPINGGSVPAGVFLNDPVFGDSLQIVGANINWGLAAFSKDANDTINQGSGSTSPYRHIGAPEQGQTGHAVLRLYGTSVDGTVPQGAIISGTDPPVRGTAAMLELQGAQTLENQPVSPASISGYTTLYSDSGTQLHTDRPFQTDQHIEITNTGSPPGAGSGGAKHYTISGHAQIQSGQTGIGGDAGTYDTERLTAVIAQQTVTSSPTITLASAPVGTLTYHIKVMVPYRGSTSAGTAVFAFTGPSVSVESCIYRNALSSAGFGATGTVTWSINPQSSFTGTFTSPTLSSSSVNVLEVDAIVTFSATGTLSFTCKAGTAGDNVAVFTGYMEVMPVLAT